MTKPTVLSHNEHFESTIRLLLGLVVAIWFFSWQNKYYPLVSGSEYTSYWLVEKGLLPYIDYHSSVLPGAIYIYWALMKLFGGKVIYVYYTGAFIRLFSAYVMYRWLHSSFSANAAALSVSTAIVISSVDIADSPAFYNHMAAALAVIATYLIRNERSSFVNALLSGLLFGLSILVKYTVGCIALGSIILCLLLFSPNKQQRFQQISVVIISCAVIVSAFIAWIVNLVGGPSVVLPLLLGGAESKGGLVASLLRPITLSLSYPELRSPFHVGLIIVVAFAAGCLYMNKTRGSRGLDRSQAHFFIWPFLLIFSLILFDQADINYRPDRYWLQVAGYLALFLPAIIFLFPPANFSEIEKLDLKLLAALSFGVAYSLSISWPSFEMMLFPGAALIIAYLFVLCREFKVRPAAMAVFQIAVALFCIEAATRKQMLPWAWGRWIEPPLAESVVQFKLPALNGFLVSQWSSHLVEGVVSDIQANTNRDDEIFVYPNMPLLYALADRRPVTYALAHWVDVCPDNIAQRDLETLRIKKPKLVIARFDTEAQLKQEESNFRNGKASGVRQMRDGLRQLLTEQYELVRTYRVYSSSQPLTVWRKRVAVAS